MILQVIVGGAAAVAVGAKFYWRRVLTVLGIRKREDEHGDGGPPAS
jgi:phosphate/sulfate permease